MESGILPNFHVHDIRCLPEPTDPASERAIDEADSYGTKIVQIVPKNRKSMRK